MPIKLKTFEKISGDFSGSFDMPMLFLAHGHPLNAIKGNEFTRTLNKLGAQIQKPEAIMIVSAHWETIGTYVSVNPNPKTIYDFGNFDSRLFDIKYEPDGHPDLAKFTASLNASITEDGNMGLDHGAWTVLKHLYPEENVPVYQLSIDKTLSPEGHYELAKQLKKLQKKGVLIIGSGNIVHNLRTLDWNNRNAKPYDWVLEFDEKVKDKLENRRFEELLRYRKLGKAAELSVPTEEHYIPMIYVLGLAEDNENINHIYEGYEYAGLSMRCFRIG